MPGVEAADRAEELRVCLSIFLESFSFGSVLAVEENGRHEGGFRIDAQKGLQIGAIFVVVSSNRHKSCIE